MANDVLAQTYAENDLQDSLKALAEAGDAAVPSILATLQRCAAGMGPDGWWRNAAYLCEALASIGTVNAKQGLVTLLKTDSQIVEWDQIRVAAAKAVGSLRDPSLIPQLSALSNEPHAPALAIQEAIRALGGSVADTSKTIIERGMYMEPREALKYYAIHAEETSEWSAEERGYFYFSWAGKVRVVRGEDAALPYYATALHADPDPRMTAWSHFPGVPRSSQSAAELASKYPLPTVP